MKPIADCRRHPGGFLAGVQGYPSKYQVSQEAGIVVGGRVGTSFPVPTNSFFQLI
jgi:hypothetical protein